MPTAPSQRFRAGLCLTLLWQGDVLHAQRFPKPRVIRVGPDGDLTLPADACGGGLCLASVDHEGHFTLHLDAPGLGGVAVIDGRPHEVGAPGGPHRMRLGPGRHATLELGEFTLLVASISPPARSLWAPWEGDGAPILFGLGLAAALALVPLHQPRPDRGVVAARDALQPASVVDDDTVVEVLVPGPPSETPALVPLPHRPAPTPAPIAQPAEPTPRESLAREVAELRARLDEVPSGERRARARELVERRVGAAIAPILEQQIPEATPGLPWSDAPAEGEPPPAGGTVAAALPQSPIVRDDDALQRQPPPVPQRKEALPPAPKLDVTLDQPPPQQIRRFLRPPQTDGALDASAVQRVLRRHRGALRACYQRALQAEPGLRVRAVLAFFVGPDGAVRSVRVRPGRGPAPDPALADCLAAASRVMRFPAATDGGSTRVELPLRFTPR